MNSKKNLGKVYAHQSITGSMAIHNGDPERCVMCSKYLTRDKYGLLQKKV